MTEIKILSDSEINNILDEMQRSVNKKKKTKSSSRRSSSRRSSSRRSSSRRSSSRRSSSRRSSKIKSLKKHIKRLKTDFFKLLKKPSETITKKNISLKKGLRRINRELRKTK